MADSDDHLAARLDAARTGSPEALGAILEACRGYLLLVAQRELDPRLQAKGGASDLVQQTVLDAVRDFPRFEGASEDELLAWLRRLLLNNVTDFARQYRATDKRAIDRERPLEAGDSSRAPGGAFAADTPTPSREVMAREQDRAIQAALGRLPENYRQIIQLRYQEERSFEEIGEQLGLTANAARKLWLRAVKRLQEEVGETP
jgi:RNA polymerase sigma-70 factor (ECF subfamily)